MRSHPSAGWLPVMALVLGGVLAAGPAGAATVTCGTASGLAGQVVTVSLDASDLTGLSVRSYEFELTYSASVVTATGVQTAGTLTGTAGWATPTFGVTSGKITVAGTGLTPLTGAGTLLKVTFLIDPSLLNGSGTGLTLSNFLFNEGSPPAVVSGGSIGVGVTPQIYVSPNSAEIVRTQTLQFSASGSVVNPVGWSTTNAGVATISGTGLLTGVAPGTVRVNALDSGGHADQSDGDILVRVAGVTVGSGAIYLGQGISIPVTTTSLTGGGVSSGEFTISWYNGYLTLVSATRPAGTLLNGFGSFNWGVQTTGSTSSVTVDFAGTSALPGTGTLFYLNFTASPATPGGTWLTLNSALFNETLPGLRTDGYLTVSAPNAFSVNPASVTLLAGQTQQFTTSGSPVLPVAWSTLDPSVATIGPTGMLTAVAGGTTRVRATDNVGGVALNTSVDVYDFALGVGTVTAPPGAIAHVPLTIDRGLAPFDVHGVEYALGWPAPWVTSATPTGGGACAVWGSPVLNPTTNSVFVAHAGAPALGGTNVLEYVDVVTNPATPSGTDIPLTLSAVLFNEGHPRPLVSGGVLRVRSTTGVDGTGSAVLALGPAMPNPFSVSARLTFTIPAAASGGERVRLAIYGADGRLVRTLADGPFAAGRHELAWDARRDDGGAVAPGVYFMRLEWAGRRLERKVAVLQ